MVRLWLHLEPIGVPARATADIDLGIDKGNLRLAGDRRVIAPLLEAQDFKPGHADEAFRFRRDFGGRPLLVDVVVAPGASREDPPLIERGLPTVAAPGLAYALLRGATPVCAHFVKSSETRSVELPLPKLDAALVLKAALAQSGVRNRPDRRITDAVDSVMLAAACLRRAGCVEALQQHRKRSDVGKALRWLEEAFRTPKAAGSRRLADHLEGDMGVDQASQWAHDVVAQLLRRVDTTGQRE